MADKEMSTRLQVSIELVHEPLLSRTVEIDHHIPAKDEIEGTLDRKLLIHQIQPSKLNHRRQMRLDLEHAFTRASPTEEMPLDSLGRDIVDTVRVVDTSRSLRQHAS